MLELSSVEQHMRLVPSPAGETLLSCASPCCVDWLLSVACACAYVYARARVYACLYVYACAYVYTCAFLWFSRCTAKRYLPLPALHVLLRSSGMSCSAQLPPALLKAAPAAPRCSAHVVCLAQRPVPKPALLTLLPVLLLLGLLDSTAAFVVPSMLDPSPLHHLCLLLTCCPLLLHVLQCPTTASSAQSCTSCAWMQHTCRVPGSTTST
jgi:hypothetical protein